MVDSATEQQGDTTDSEERSERDIRETGPDTDGIGEITDDNSIFDPMTRASVQMEPKIRPS